MGIRTSDLKQPREIVFKGIDFTGDDKLAEGDTLKAVNCSIIVTDDQGADVTSTMLVSGSMSVSVPNNTIVCRIQGGETGREYKVTFLAGTEQGELLEEDIILPVEEL